MNIHQINSRLVTGIGYLACLALLLLPGSVLIVRLGSWKLGLQLYATTCLLGSVVLLSLMVLAVIPRYKPVRQAIAKRALLVLPCALLLGMIVAGPDYPPIHDISTNTTNPPQFIKATSLRGATSNSLDIKPETITQQQESYPQLGTLHLAIAPAVAYETALDIASELGWEVHHRDQAAGIIEAVATTTIMGFKDDIVVRLRPERDGTVVDLRSVSRVGQSDLGANARRIGQFLDLFSLRDADG